MFTNRFDALRLLCKRCRTLNIKIPYYYLLLVGFISTISTLLGTITPYLYSKLVDDVMVGGKLELLFGIITKMIAMFLINMMLSLLSTYFSVKFNNRVNLLMRMNLFKRILKKNVATLCEGDIGKEQELILKDSSIISGFLMVQIKDYICAVLFVLIYIGMMLYVSIPLTIVSLIIVPIVTIWGRYVGKKLNQAQLELWEVSSKNANNIFNSIQRWKEIKIQCLEERMTKQYNDSLQPEKNINLTWMLYFALDGIVYEVKNSFVQNIVPYFVGGILIMQNHLTIGALLMFITYLTNMSGHIDVILTSLTNFESNRAAFGRVFDMLDLKEEEGKPLADCPANCDISIEKIDFAYSETLPMIFQNADYKFLSGKSYLLRGKSGGGKSTLIKLLSGVLAPNSGEIKYGGIPIEEIDPGILFKKLGLIMQDSYFFNFSIRENLAILNDDVTDEDIEKACKLACISEYIDTLPDKYDTLLGERGVKLSGGQRQRLAIARMILHRPEILIMDEATSSLDNNCESLIMKNLEKEFKNKLVIVISHKPDIAYDFYKTIHISERGIREGNGNSFGLPQNADGCVIAKGEVAY